MHQEIVLGLGLTGLSVVRYLVSQGRFISVIDTRDHPPGADILKAEFPQVILYTGGYHPEILASASRIIISPGLAKDHPDLLALKNNIAIVGDIELFAHAVQAPVVAITGSNGKSTVTSLITYMAELSNINVAAGANLGEPALSLLKKEPELYCLELSSFQLETTASLHTKVAAILNVTEDHMDRYPDLNAYRQAKLRIYQHCDLAVFNRDDLKTQPPPSLPSISFGLDQPQPGHWGLVEKGNQGYLAYGQECWLPISDMLLKGSHHVANALAALAIGQALGLAPDAMLAALKTFAGLPHRCEWVGERDGVIWINDSKGTNVGATVAALNGLADTILGRWILIAGGEGKNADFSPLLQPVSQHCKAVVLLGKAAEELNHLFYPHVPCFRVATLKEAVHQAQLLARVHDGVLLSPACASFDMYRNYEERGEDFRQIVSEIAL